MPTQTPEEIGGLDDESGEIVDGEQDDDPVLGSSGLDLDVDESPIARFRRLRQHEVELLSQIEVLSEELETLHGYLDATREEKRRTITAIEHALDESSGSDEDEAVASVLRKIQEAREW